MRAFFSVLLGICIVFHFVDFLIDAKTGDDEDVNDKRNEDDL